MKKPELLVPAGSLEVLKVAVNYGADAVYIGGEAFGLRAKAKNFSSDEMREGIAFAHAHGVKVYVTAKGDYYYPSPDRGPLTRHVHVVSPDDVPDLCICSRCRERDHAA